MNTTFSSPKEKFEISKALQSNIFYDALYKNIPNMYLLHEINVVDNLEKIFEYFYDLIKDYYIEKSYCELTASINIANVFIVLQKDVLLHLDGQNNNCIIMYANTTKDYVHKIKDYMLQFQNR